MKHSHCTSGGTALAAFNSCKSRPGRYLSAIMRGKSCELSETRVGLLAGSTSHHLCRPINQGLVLISSNNRCFVLPWLNCTSGTCCRATGPAWQHKHVGMCRRMWLYVMLTHWCIQKLKSLSHAFCSVGDTLGVLLLLLLPC